MDDFIREEITEHLQKMEANGKYFIIMERPPISNYLTCWEVLFSKAVDVVESLADN